MKTLWRAALGLLAAEVLPGRCPLCSRLSACRGACPDCLRSLSEKPSGLCPGCGDRTRPGSDSFLRGAVHICPNETEQPLNAGGPSSGAPACSSGEADRRIGEEEQSRATAGLCRDCLAFPRPWDGLGFYGLYAGGLRDLVLSLKFGAGVARLRLLTDLLAQAYCEYQNKPGGFAPGSPQVVTGAPMHWTKLVIRGYNQSHELAKALAARLGAACSGRAVAKHRRTQAQSRLGGTARLQNLRGAFSADASVVAGKRVLVVDDVMTTGSTLAEISHALRAGGAARVEVLVLARDVKIRG